MANTNDSNNETKIENTKQQGNTLINRGTTIVFGSVLGLPGLIAWETFKYMANQCPDSVNHMKQSIYNFFVNTDGKIKVSNVLVTTGVFIGGITLFIILNGESSLPSRTIFKPALKKNLPAVIVPLIIDTAKEVITPQIIAPQPEMGKELVPFYGIEAGSPQEAIFQMVRDFMWQQAIKEVNKTQ